MKICLAIVLCSLGLAAVGKEREPLKVPALISKEEQAAREAKDESDFAAALARLPAFNRERIEEILDALRGLDYPVEYELLKKRIGGPDALVWTSTSFSDSRRGFHRQISTFSVSASSPEYQLVIDYVESPIDQRSSEIARARLCYFSPFGWRFAAESIEDLLNFEDTTAKER